MCVTPLGATLLSSTFGSHFGLGGGRVKGSTLPGVFALQNPCEVEVLAAHGCPCAQCWRRIRPHGFVAGGGGGEHGHGPPVPALQPGTRGKPPHFASEVGREAPRRVIQYQGPKDESKYKLIDTVTSPTH